MPQDFPLMIPGAMTDDGEIGVLCYPVKGIGVGCGAGSGVSEGAAAYLPDAGRWIRRVAQRGSAYWAQVALRALQGHTSPGRAQGSKEMARGQLAYSNSI